jgi:hypothetical protein
MSILSIFEATPNRIRALARLSGNLGPVSREDLRLYFLPGGKDSGQDQFNNLLRETIRIGLLREQSGEVSLSEGISSENVSDDTWVRAYLDQSLLMPKDEAAENRAFPFALAWLLGQPAGEIMPWNSDQHLRMERQLEGRDLYEITNKERFAMLCYWGRYLGFVTRLGHGSGNIAVPDPTEAMASRLADIFADVSRMPIALFFERLAPRCAVLEQGDVRRVVEGRAREKRADNDISSATSLAFWRLEKRGRLRLMQDADADAWLMKTSLSATGAGASRRVSHVEYLV